MQTYQTIMWNLVKGTSFELSPNGWRRLDNGNRRRAARVRAHNGYTQQYDFVCLVLGAALMRGSVNAAEIALIALSMTERNKREDYAVVQHAHQVVVSQTDVGSRWIVGVRFDEAPRFLIDEIER